MLKKIGLILVIMVTAAAAQTAINSISANTDPVGLYEKLELTVDLNALYSNPFDQAQMHLYANFTAPDGQSFAVDGFYYEDYIIDPWGNPNQIGEEQWKVRFTPTQPGAWTYQLFLDDFLGSAQSDVITFDCTASDNPGFVRSNHPRYLEFDNGDPYFAIGHNICWWNNNGTNDYDTWMTNLADAGGNYFRIWMVSWGTAIEWDNTGLGNYTNRMDRAYQLDWIFENARQMGIYIMLCLNNHGQVSTNVNPEWNNNPYNASNGGPCSNTWDFFTNQSAKNYYKHRLDYIIARWGYSPNILTWESFNEVEWTDEFESHQDDVTDWHEEMSQYIASNDVYDHLITTSYAMAQNDPDTWELSEIDITQTHHYTSSADPQSIHYDWTQTYLQEFDKPTLVGEFGIDDFLNNDPTGIHFHNCLWAGLMSGSFGTPASWWWDNYIQPNDLYSNYTGIANFVDAVDLLGNAYVPVKPLCVSDETSDLIISPAYTTWGMAPASYFEISTDGSIYPSVGNLGTYLFGAQWNTQHRNPPTFHITYPADGTFTVITGANTGQSPTIRIVVDGIQLLNTPAEVNTEYTVNVDAGEHTILVSNQGTDWIQINSYVFSGVVTAIRSFALESPTSVIGWIQNRDYNWYNVLVNGAPEIIQNSRIQFDLTPGQWELNWINCSNGYPDNTIYINAGSEPTLIDVPDLPWDAAFRLTLDSAYCEPHGDITGDGNVDVLDVVAMVAHILQQLVLPEDIICHANLQDDGEIDVLDIVAMVDLILNSR